MPAMKARRDPDALESIPGVGPSIARDLRDLGYVHASDLRGENPTTMYYALCDLRGAHIDRCVLYVFRCAVYYTSHDVHDPELLQWWRWKDAVLLDRDLRRTTRTQPQPAPAVAESQPVPPTWSAWPACDD